MAAAVCVTVRGDLPFVPAQAVPKSAFYSLSVQGGDELFTQSEAAAAAAVCLTWTRVFSHGRERCCRWSRADAPSFPRSTPSMSVWLAGSQGFEGFALLMSAVGAPIIPAPESDVAVGSLSARESVLQRHRDGRGACLGGRSRWNLASSKSPGYFVSFVAGYNSRSRAVRALSNCSE